MSKWEHLTQEELKIGMQIVGYKKNALQIKYAKDICKLQQENKQLKEDKKKAIEYINTHYLNANEPKLLEILGDKE